MNDDKLDLILSFLCISTIIIAVIVFIVFSWHAVTLPTEYYPKYRVGDCVIEKISDKEWWELSDPSLLQITRVGVKKYQFLNWWAESHNKMPNTMHKGRLFTVIDFESFDNTFKIKVECPKEGDIVPDLIRLDP